MEYVVAPGFGMFHLIFILMFIMVFGTFLVNAIRGIREWNHNNSSPRLTVPATVVAKRTDVYRRRSGNNHHYHTSTTYFVTFEVESGDRMELRLEGHEYGMLVEGDHGKLTFQGTRYLGFERT